MTVRSAVATPEFYPSEGARRARVLRLPGLAGAAVRADDRRADRRLELEAAAAAVVRGVLGGDRGAVPALGEQVGVPGRGRLGGGRRSRRDGAPDDVRAARGERAAIGGA